MSLNIASTRLDSPARLEGVAAAGEVIRAFGNFVVGGNYTVGLIVFLILVIINFVVITVLRRARGRSVRLVHLGRHAWQAEEHRCRSQCRFDQRVGGAGHRRKQIAEEADFYGAMDGASKFRQADAVKIS
ncbi:MAG: FHIPEP family type III secretion protein [Nitrospiraceae bacterium]